MNKNRLTIYHTNDIHSNFDFLGKVDSYLNTNRGEHDIYLDSGDYLDLKSILVEADRGQSALELFFSVGLDALALGNNEIDLGKKDLCILVDQYKICSSNIKDNNDEDVSTIKKSIIIERFGKKFLIIFVSPFFSDKLVEDAYNTFFMMGNIKTINCIDTIREELSKVDYDFSILASHSGYNVDKMIMDTFPEIDLVLGGHSHSVVNEKNYIQSGMGEYLSKIDIEIDEQEIKIVDKQHIDVSSEKVTKHFKDKLMSISINADKIMSKELPSCFDLHFNMYEENELINFICDALMDKFSGDFAIMHHGIAENSLLRPISKKTLIEVLPSKLNPTIYKISGEKIKEAVLLSFDEEHIKQSGRGSGFRGSRLGTLGFSSNVKINREPFKVAINDEPLVEDREYTIITDDYLQRGTGYPSLKTLDEQCYYHKWFIRDLVEHYLERVNIYTLSKKRRIF